MWSGFEVMFKQEIKYVKVGCKVYVIFKMNSLEDFGMIEKVYEVCQAGVKVQLIVCGICCVVLDVEGVSENLEVISIVDCFLEYVWVYIFGNGGEECLFFVLVDWMICNLDCWVEVVFLVYDEKICEEIWYIIYL